MGTQSANEAVKSQELRNVSVSSPHWPPQSRSPKNVPKMPLRKARRAGTAAAPTLPTLFRASRDSCSDHQESPRFVRPQAPAARSSRPQNDPLHSTNANTKKAVSTFLRAPRFQVVAPLWRVRRSVRTAVAVLPAMHSELPMPLRFDSGCIRITQYSH